MLALTYLHAALAHGITKSVRRRDEDTKERRKDTEQEICVISWNVNKSTAQYDSLCHANVVMFQEIQSKDSIC